jgi:hypothetical protein
VRRGADYVRLLALSWQNGTTNGDEAKAAFRAAGERLLSPEKADEKCSG